MVRFGLAGGIGLACVAVWLSSCTGGQHASERLMSQRERVALQPSAPFDLEGTPVYASASPNDARLVCGTVRCLVTYWQNMAGSSFALATRVGRDGVVQDTPRLVLGKGGFVIQSVAAHADDFVVVSSSFNEFGFAEQVTLVHGSTGALEDITSKVPSGVHLVGGSDDGYVFLYGGGPLSARACDASLTPLGSPVPLAPADRYKLEILPGRSR